MARARCEASQSPCPSVSFAPFTPPSSSRAWFTTTSRVVDASRHSASRSHFMVPHAWNINIDFIGRMYGILIVSAVLCVGSLVALFTMGLNFGTDFAGGYEIQVHFPKPETETQIRDILAPMDLQ